MTSSPRILHVIPSIGPARGGPSQVVKTLARGLEQAGFAVDIVTTDDDGSNRLDVPFGKFVTIDGVRVRFFKRLFRYYTLAPSLGSWVRSHVGDYDLVHIHALFSYSSMTAAGIARKAGVPYVLRPLGTLNEWGLNNRRTLLKRISLKTIENKLIEDAAGLHFTSEAEMDEASRVVSMTEAFVVPNPVDPPPHSDTKRDAAGGKTVLFLSRIDRKKRLDLLLEAVTVARREDPAISLDIAGTGPSALLQELRDQAGRFGIDEHVRWQGQVRGADKERLLREANLFVLPSESENFGVAVAEALAHGLPVMISPGVGIRSLVERYEAGVVVDADADKWGKEIALLLSSPKRLELLSSNGWKLYSQELTPEAVSRQLTDVYRKLLAQT